MTFQLQIFILQRSYSFRSCGSGCTYLKHDAIQTVKTNSENILNDVEVTAHNDFWITLNLCILNMEGNQA